MRRILLIIMVAGLCYAGWRWVRPMLIKMVCENKYEEVLTSAGPLSGATGKTEAMRADAEEAYQSCLHDWGLEEGSP